MTNRAGSLWAITCFFNPAHSTRRLQNYQRFRAALAVPLATIELGFDACWQLSSQDADYYVRVGDGDVLWQKERLLNLLLPKLPAECAYVAWLDSDVLFGDEQWPQQAIEALQHAPVAQLFTSLIYLRPDGSRPANSPPITSVVAVVQAGHAPADVIGRVTDRTGGAASPGMAWAAHRSLLQHHGFYDGCVIGGGDTAFLCAAYGIPEVVMQLHRMNDLQRQRYGEWAMAVYRDVHGELAALPGELQHLWHGELADRRAGQRHADLALQQFDPYRDLRPGKDGAWRWASDKPALHGLLREYFRRRNEDGD